MLPVYEKVLKLSTLKGRYVTSDALREVVCYGDFWASTDIHRITIVREKGEPSVLPKDYPEKDRMLRALPKKSADPVEVCIFEPPLLAKAMKSLFSWSVLPDKEFRYIHIDVRKEQMKVSEHRAFGKGALTSVRIIPVKGEYADITAVLQWKYLYGFVRLLKGFVVMSQKRDGHCRPVMFYQNELEHLIMPCRV